MRVSALPQGLQGACAISLLAGKPGRRCDSRSSRSNGGRPFHFGKSFEQPSGFALNVGAPTFFTSAVTAAAALEYTSRAMNSASVHPFPDLPTAYAWQLRETVGAEAFPESAMWEKASVIRFDHDWRGANADPQRATEVRLLWNAETLFLRFDCKFRELHVFPDARMDGWRDQLWDRDVAEAFLQPDDCNPRVYKELEVAPNGYWIDLSLAHGQKEEMHSGLRHRVWQDAQAKTWTAGLSVPMRSLTPSFDPQKPWRANFYRVEGRQEPRFYAAWSPTLTPQPNFHIPAAFGHLVFREDQ